MRKWLRKKRSRKIHPYDPNKSLELDEKLEKRLKLYILIIIIIACSI